MAFGIVQKTGEMGVRMALGARRTSIVWLVLREALLLVAFRIVIHRIASELRSHESPRVQGRRDYGPGHDVGRRHRFQMKIDGPMRVPGVTDIRVRL